MIPKARAHFEPVRDPSLTLAHMVLLSTEPEGTTEHT